MPLWGPLCLLVQEDTFLFYFLFWGDRVCLCSPDWPGIHIDLPASAMRVLRLKASATMPSHEDTLKHPVPDTSSPSSFHLTCCHVGPGWDRPQRIG